MVTCDLCGKEKDCLQKEIDGKEYDLCCECWEPLAQKLRGKGREKFREMVLLPPRTIKEKEGEEPKPPSPPGRPPVIQGVVLVSLISDLWSDLGL